MGPGSVAILPGAKTVFMTGIIPFPYRPDPDLMFCTGVMQHAVAVIQSEASAQPASSGGSRLVLFLDPPDPNVGEGMEDCVSCVSLHGPDFPLHRKTGGTERVSTGKRP